jgi:hypothetical protein
MTTLVHNPVSVLSGRELAPANAMPASLDGATVVLLDNSKHNAGELLQRVRTAVDAAVPGINWQVERKAGAFRPVSDEISQRIRERADLVITGNGDCGCASWSSGDTAKFEKEGIPVVLLVTTPFVPLAHHLTRSAGVEGARIVEVPHPVGGLQSDALDERVAAVKDTVIQLLAG